jgi:hypothetical protein
MDFNITYWEVDEPYFELRVDGKTTLSKIKKGDLRHIFNEMEKFARLRFKGELQHKKK